MREVADPKEQMEREVAEYKKSVELKLKRLGIHKLRNPEIDEKLFTYIDASNLSDRELGNRYLAAQQMGAYVMTCAARADIESTYALAMKDQAYARALVTSGGSSADDRKAEAEIAYLHKHWNMVYLRKRGEFRLLQASASAYEKLGETWSREMTRRRISWEQSKDG